MVAGAARGSCLWHRPAAAPPEYQLQQQRASMRILVQLLLASTEERMLPLARSAVCPWVCARVGPGVRLAPALAAGPNDEGNGD